MRVLDGFVMQLALPALVFQALAQRRFAEILNVSFLVAYAFGALIVMAAGWFYARRLQGRDAGFSALVGMGVNFSNSGFVGYPIAVQLLGPTAAAYSTPSQPARRRQLRHQPRHAGIEAVPIVFRPMSA